MLTKLVKTKNNTYNVTLDYSGDTVIEYTIESIDKNINEKGLTWANSSFIDLIKEQINKIEGRNIFQEELFKKWDGIID